MGIAVISGVIASLESASASASTAPPKSPKQIPRSSSFKKWESHTPGTSTPIVDYSSEVDADHSIPSKFYACCNREVTATRLRNLFQDHDGLGQSVKVVQGENVKAVKDSEAVLLWYVGIPLHVCNTGPRSDGPDSCKPQLAHGILTEEGMKDALEGKLLISILAGVTIAQIQQWVSPTTTVIRAMPNTPCKVRLPLFALVLL